MKSKILTRILREAQAPELFDVLVERLSLADLQSLLLAVYRKKVQRLSPSALFEQYQHNRFVQASQLDPAQQLAFDRLAFSQLPTGFEALDLSPVAPLASCSAIAPVDQNNALTTIRNTEVCSDPTNVMALECAVRRKNALKKQPKSTAKIKLACSQRVVRTQVFDMPDAYPHFQLFALCSAGRDQGAHRFERAALFEHIDFYLHLLSNLGQLDRQVHRLKVQLFADSTHKFMQAVDSDLRSRHPAVHIEAQPFPTGQSYYHTARFHIFASDAKGKEYFLVDGGMTDWTQQLLSNKKERLLISGLGSERLLRCF